MRARAGRRSRRRTGPTPNLQSIALHVHEYAHPGIVSNPPAAMAISMNRNAGRTTISPSRAESPARRRATTLVPVDRALTADLETPHAFLRLAADEPQSFLLESVEGGEKDRPLYLYRCSLTAPSWPELHCYQRARQEPVGAKGCFCLLKELLAGQSRRIFGSLSFTSEKVRGFVDDAVRQLERLPSLAKMIWGIRRLPDVRPGAGLLRRAQDPAGGHCRSRRQKPAAAYKDARQRLERLEKRLRGDRRSATSARGKLLR